MGQVYTLPLGGYRVRFTPPPHLGKYRVKLTLFYSVSMGQAYSLPLGKYRVRLTPSISVGMGQVYSLLLGGYRVRFTLFY